MGNRADRAWQRELADEWAEAKAARLADENPKLAAGLREFNHREKFGSIAGGREHLWKPKKPPTEPCQRKVHPQHRAQGFRAGRRPDWHRARFRGPPTYSWRSTRLRVRCESPGCWDSSSDCKKQSAGRFTSNSDNLSCANEGEIRYG